LTLAILRADSAASLDRGDPALSQITDDVARR